MLSLIPGLSSVTRSNPSQDPRLSIRGFGARSAFGVRGIRVLRDGMPLTLPDGQTPLDYLSLESVGRIEVMRGAASALYGNASGGVVDIRSPEPAPSLLAFDARQWVGEDELFRSAFAASGSTGRFGYVADAAHSRSDGSRDHSFQRATTGFGRATYSSGRMRYALSVMALHNPLAENPGALTLEEMRADPRAADPQSIRRDAAKRVRQIQIGATAARAFSGGEASMSAYGGARSLDNPLTFAVVEIGRHSWGGNASLVKEAAFGGMRHGLSAGIEAQLQNDLRRNYAACSDTVKSPIPTASCPDIGSARGIVNLDQREIVSSVGAYLSDDVRLNQRLTVTAGVRADNIHFEVRDRLVSSSNPDDSGERTLYSISPLAGIVARISPLASIYANVSTAFETPTATELGNQPDGTAGINRELDPQRSLTFEVGTKGFVGTRIRYDAAIFNTIVRDELVPFEIPASDGRRYFRNAGRTKRVGAEAGSDIAIGPLTLMAAYTYSRFRFVEFETGSLDFGGNRIPGIPEHRIQSAATMTAGSWFAVVENESTSKSFGDDANTFRISGYSVFHVRGGVTPFRRTPRAGLIVSVTNVLDRTYAPSIAVNAARQRYFEPAAKRSVAVGISIGADSK